MALINSHDGCLLYLISDELADKMRCDEMSLNLYILKKNFQYGPGKKKKKKKTESIKMTTRIKEVAI